MPEMLKTQLTDFFYELHRTPELSNQEFHTTQKIKDVLTQYDIRILDLPIKTGLVAEIGHGEPTIVLRSDIDALPITEQADVAYVSEHQGVMHACGHDFHATAVLGTAILLKQQESTLQGKVRILFQAAEEVGTGAAELVQAGVLEQAQAVFGIHNDPTLEVGVVGCKAGALTAGVDRFAIHIQAKGTHAARPQDGNDPLLILANIINIFQTIVSRRLSSDENAVLSITQVHSGSTWNIIPDTAFLEGTVRSFDAETRQRIEQQIRQILEGLATTFNAKIDLDWQPGPPSVMNDEKWAQFALDTAQKSGFEPRVVKASPIGEDFSYYQEQVNGAFMMIGSGGPFPLHHPKFKVDERILIPTSLYLATLVQDALIEIQDS
ncbi:amidohydrolase [Acinetobacter sp. B5B]|nr:amidohydrolase [Acinetobacter baretiae]MBF7685408.1 amidohydrolase [Acinetobacter baretiae]